MASNGNVVVAGGNDELLYSEDGINWQRADNPPFGRVDSIAWGQDRFVASNGLNILLSRDGVSWELAGRDDVFIRQIRWVGYRFMAVGSRGNPLRVTVMESVDGYNWTSTATNYHGFGQDIAYNNQVWVVVWPSQEGFMPPEI